MLKNWKAAVAAMLLSVSMFGAGAAFTGSAAAQTFTGVRGEGPGARNMLYVRRRLEAMIDQLQRDPRDYDGHRVAAIGDLQQARVQIIDAIQWDATHPGQ
jgi:hypothetical protein